MPPAGKAITAVAFTGYSNYDPKEGTTAASWLAEVNGVEYGETDYPFIHNANKSTYPTYTIPLASPVTGGLTFTPGSKQSCFIITLTVHDSTTGISDATRLTDKVQWTKDNVYDLQGRRVAQPAKGLFIVNGKKVVVK